MKKSLQKTSRNLTLLLFLTVIMLTGLILTINKEFEHSAVLLRKNELKRLVDFGLNSIDEYRFEYTNGQITREEALKKISDQIRKFTYEDELQPNYLFMSTYDGIMLVQPYQPEKEGSNQLDLVDYNGKFIIKELISQAKKEPGYVTYKYTPAGSTVAYNKISYVRGLPELDCYIGTGMYSADIDHIIRKHFTKTLLFIMTTIIVLIGSTIAIVYPIILSAKIIANSLIKIGDDLMVEAPSLPTNSFKKNSDAKNLLVSFSEIVEKLAAQNRAIIKTAEEKDKLKTEHIHNTEMLIKEMNHRIKNNLQIIISLLNIQLRQAENKELRESYLETISRLESISMIHNMLYSNGNFSSIPGHKYIRDLVTYIIHSFGVKQDIMVEFNIDITEFTIDQAVSLGIITNEVITNSIKYAFPEGSTGVISVSLTTEEDKHTFKICDDGPGISRDELENRKSSLGISLIRNLSTQLRGKLEIETAKGTSYTITF